MIDTENLKVHIYDIIGALHTVHKELGAGVNEYCYQEALEIELLDRKIPFEREKSFHPTYKGHLLNAEYRVDFLCKGNVIVECKAVSAITPTHRAQLFNYMRLMRVSCGILVNFYPKFATIERYFYDEEESEIFTVDGKKLEERTVSAAELGREKKSCLQSCSSCFEIENEEGKQQGQLEKTTFSGVRANSPAGMRSAAELGRVP